MWQLIKKIVVLFKRAVDYCSMLRKIPAAKAIADLPSYYPDKPRKTRKQRIKDNVKWLLKYCEVNEFYTLYGLDLAKSKDQSVYKDYRHFMLERNKQNHYREAMSQLVLLRDKYLFYKYMVATGSPVAEVFAVIKNGKVYDANLNYVGEEYLRDKTDYFVKAANGECANFVQHIDSFDDFLSIQGKLQNGDYIIQKRIVQSPEMCRLNEKAINTMRIVTIYNNGNPCVFSALLRIGTSATGNVDNWARGGIAVNIMDDGFLGEIGYFKPSYGQTTLYHPDTKVKFAEFQVPLYEEAVKLTCKAHRHFYGVESIGWDIAVSEHGLVIIEGNDNWEISLHQAAEGPLRKKWDNRFGK